MMREFFKAKIHRATVTDANLNYSGSISIDPVLLEAADILPHEKVQVLNLNTGDRAWTYVIEGKRGKGEIVLNGAIARQGQVGDIVIVISYCLLNEDEIKSFKPRTIAVDNRNQIVHS